ncbi:hypothetical protein V8F20_012387 [Naviculisporaceae sp. PSN 640]
MQRDKLPSLLLLPSPPQPFSQHLLNAAYRAPLTATLAKLKASKSQAESKLVIAVALPVLQGQFIRSKTLSWAESQSLLAGIYTLVSVICAQLSIPTELDGGPGSVDATVILVDHDRDKRIPPDLKPAIETNSTVVVDLATFATAYHPWNYIFHVRCERGLQLNQTYLKLAEGKQTLLQEQLVPVEGGLTLNNTPKEIGGSASEQQQQQPSPPQQTAGYPVVCLGGTFDYLHPGHKLLLTAGALLLRVPHKDSKQSCLYIIGITGDELLKNKKYAELVQSWEVRALNVITFLSRLLHLSEQGWKTSTGNAATPAQIDKKDGDFRASFRNNTIQVQCVRIQDPFGPTVTREDIQALVVSGETRSGGKAVNDRRIEQGWKALDVFEVDVLNADEMADEVVTKTENFAAKISSSAIRQQRHARAKLV